MGDARYLSEWPAALVIGGHGKTAIHLTHLLVPTHEVHSLIRDPAQIPDVEGIGAHPVVQDLVAATVTDLVDILQRVRPSVVVWAASNPRAPVEVDRDAYIKVIDALARADVPTRRFVAISAADVRDREQCPTPDWYSEADIKLSDRMWGIIEPALRAKFEADRELLQGNGRRKLDYTVVRPGGLADREPEETVRAGKVGLLGMISRVTLAGVLFAVIRDEATVGLAFDVLGPGHGDEAIVSAVHGVGVRKEDTFEGFY